MKIKLYIVTEAEFDTDKPRSNATVPEILITTTNKAEAIKIVRERRKAYQSMEGYEIDTYDTDYDYDEGFTFDDTIYFYGHVELHEQEIEVNKIETSCNKCGKSIKFTKVTCKDCNKEGKNG